jgi:hypothetical protein
MKTIKIEIHENDTINTGTYCIWYKQGKELKKLILSENKTDSLLNMRQKEQFFIGKYKFNVSFYDLKQHDPGLI